jgi:hypothetical protein
MTLTRCSNGHFFDEDKYKSCPHCGTSVGDSGVTVGFQRNDSVTVAMEDGDRPTEKMASGGSLQSDVSKASGAGRPVVSDGDSVTVSFSSKQYGLEPVAGWLVCVEGKHFGEDFRLKAGRNFIGRASGMDVAISKDNSVSREKHAIVVYDPQENIFLVQPGESRELCYLNEKLVLSAVELKAFDVLKVGESKLMFFPCCGENFNWEKYQKPVDLQK